MGATWDPDLPAESAGASPATPELERQAARMRLRAAIHECSVLFGGTDEVMDLFVEDLTAEQAREIQERHDERARQIRKERSS